MIVRGGRRGRSSCRRGPQNWMLRSASARTNWSQRSKGSRHPHWPTLTENPVGFFAYSLDPPGTFVLVVLHNLTIDMRNGNLPLFDFTALLSIFYLRSLFWGCGQMIWFEILTNPLLIRCFSFLCVRLLLVFRSIVIVTSSFLPSNNSRSRVTMDEYPRDFLVFFPRLDVIDVHLQSGPIS